MESRFRFSPSPFLFFLLAAAGATTIAGTWWIITTPPLPRICAASVMAALFAHAIYRHAILRGKYAVRAISFLPKNQVEVAAPDGIYQGHLQSAKISPLLSVFVVKCEQKQFNVLAAFDCMPKDRHRQLRIRLKMYAAPPPPQQ